MADEASGVGDAEGAGFMLHEAATGGSIMVKMIMRLPHITVQRPGGEAEDNWGSRDKGRGRAQGKGDRRTREEVGVRDGEEERMGRRTRKEGGKEGTREREDNHIIW